MKFRFPILIDVEWVDPYDVDPTPCLPPDAHLAVVFCNTTGKPVDQLTGAGSERVRGVVWNESELLDFLSWYQPTIQDRTLPRLAIPWGGISGIWLMNRVDCDVVADGYRTTIHIVDGMPQ